MQTSISSHPRNLTLPPLAFPHQPGVIIVGGWGGSGKTTFIAQALSGLSEYIKNVGVIINERSASSVEVDLKRLPPGFEKLGLHGCACCSQLPDILQGVNSFLARQRSLTFIEQSPFSRTGDIKNELIKQGHAAISVYMFNPHQFELAPLNHMQGILEADVVVMTHTTAGTSAFKRGAEIIADVRRNLPKIPLSLRQSGDEPISPKLWSDTTAQLAKIDPHSLQHLVAPQVRSDQFEQDRKRWVDAYSEIPLVPIPKSADDLYQAVLQLKQGGIQVERVKGFLANSDNVDITRDQVGFKLTRFSSNYVGQEAISVRSFDVNLRRVLPDLARSLGTPDASPAFVTTILSTYPDLNEIEELIKSERAPMGFEADRPMYDLLQILPSLHLISDNSRVAEIGGAIVRLLGGAIGTRLHIVNIAEKTALNSGAGMESLFNACYSLSAIICDPNLQLLFTRIPALDELRRDVIERGAISKLVHLVGSIPRIRFEGRRQLTAQDLTNLGSTLASAVELTLISQDQINSMLQSLKRNTDLDFIVQKNALLKVLERNANT